MSTKGKHIASSPSDTGDDVDTPWLEEFYQSWELEKRIESILKDESKDNKQISHAIKKHDADFIKAFCLTEHNFTANEFISASSATIINDDFGDPLGVLIAGKLFNDYFKPLKEFYDATGLVCAIYSGITPIVHMGIGDSEKDDVSKKIQLSETGNNRGITGTSRNIGNNRDVHKYINS